MASLSKNKRGLIALLLVVSAAGCTEYYNNWDRVSTRAGNAHEANTAIMEVVPSNSTNVQTRVGF